jgi:5,6-dimethylbenzimidazole synthase
MTAFETAEFRATFDDLLAWRRDVRRFRSDPLPDVAIADLLQAAALAPSVGLSQPWRFARVRSSTRRGAVRDNFERCNARALTGYEGDDAELYARLKLEGLSDAPEQWAIFCDHGTSIGRGLGRQTMPEMLDYSVVTAVHTLWLKARTLGVGVGWVSILDPESLRRDLEVPADWKLIAYLCIGFPKTISETPELEIRGWERRLEPHPILEL